MSECGDRGEFGVEMVKIADSDYQKADYHVDRGGKLTNYTWTEVSCLREKRRVQRKQQCTGVAESLILRENN